MHDKDHFTNVKEKELLPQPIPDVGETSHHPDEKYPRCS